MMRSNFANEEFTEEEQEIMQVRFKFVAKRLIAACEEMTDELIENELGLENAQGQTLSECVSSLLNQAKQLPGFPANSRT